MIRRSISTTALLFASISAILGSGWLFTAYYTSIIAGPSAILSWLVGGLALGIVAFTFAELSAMLPITGSSTRIPHFTHGTVVSFLFAWIIWLSYAALAPTEVQAVVQYISYYFPYLVHADGGLTKDGYISATILMILVSAINIFSLRWLLRCNNILTAMKLAIPVIISLTLLLLFFTGKNHIYFGHKGFFPMGWHGTFAAIAAGGIVFAFNGFKQACEMAGEAKKPKKALPVAIIGSIAISLTVYLLLQFAFLTCIHKQDLLGGWASMHLTGGNSPFAAILSHGHHTFLLAILYLGAIIGPLAAGLMYMSSASRSLYAMSKNDYLPLLFQKLTTQGNPFAAIVINFAFGMFMFAPLPGWNKMVGFLTSLMALTYAISPVCLLALRDQAPTQHRPFKLPFIRLWTWLAFYICTLLSYWSGWTVISKLAIALILGLIVLFSYHHFTKRGRELTFHWRASIWVWPYFSGLILISYLGNFGQGLGRIPFGWDFVIIGIYCIFILWLSQRYKLPASVTQGYIAKLNLGEIGEKRG